MFAACCRAWAYDQGRTPARVRHDDGYSTPIVPSTAGLMPDDNITKMNPQYVGEGGGRSDNRFGWVRT